MQPLYAALHFRTKSGAVRLHPETSTTLASAGVHQVCEVAQKNEWSCTRYGRNSPSGFPNQGA